MHIHRIKFNQILLWHLNIGHLIHKAWPYLSASWQLTCTFLKSSNNKITWFSKPNVFKEVFATYLCVANKFWRVIKISGRNLWTNCNKKVETTLWHSAINHLKKSLKGNRGYPLLRTKHLSLEGRQDEGGENWDCLATKKCLNSPEVKLFKQ